MSLWIRLNCSAARSGRGSAIQPGGIPVLVFVLIDRVTRLVPGAYRGDLSGSGSRHSRTVPSQPPDRARRPSGAKATLVTGAA